MGISLCIMPTGLPEKENKPWKLAIRSHELSGTTYGHLCYLTDDKAEQVIEAGKAHWLYGEPNWKERAKAKELEHARVLKEKALGIESKYKVEESIPETSFKTAKNLEYLGIKEIEIVPWELAKGELGIQIKRADGQYFAFPVRCSERIRQLLLGEKTL